MCHRVGNRGYHCWEFFLVWYFILIRIFLFCVLYFRAYFHKNQKYEKNTVFLKPKHHFIFNFFSKKYICALELVLAVEPEVLRVVWVIWWMACKLGLCLTGCVHSHYLCDFRQNLLSLGLLQFTIMRMRHIKIGIFVYFFAYFTYLNKHITLLWIFPKNSQKGHGMAYQMVVYLYADSR